jgi:hypothetical protein
MGGDRVLNSENYFVYINEYNYINQERRVSRFLHHNIQIFQPSGCVKLQSLKVTSSFIFDFLGSSFLRIPM